MDLLQTLKSLVNERLSAAAEEIFGAVGQIVKVHEDEALYLKQEIDRQSRLLDMVLKPYIKLQGADILQLPLCKEDIYPEQPNMNSSLVQEEPQPPKIKEEEGELLLRPNEGLTLLAVKMEDDAGEYDGDKRETEPIVSTSTQLRDAEHCGTSQPSDDKLLSSHGSESDTEDSDEWEETRQNNSALNQLKAPNHQCLEGHTLSNKLSQDMQSPKQTYTGKKRFSCTHCGKMFNLKTNLKRHTMVHTGEKPFTCTVCGKGCAQKSSLKTHMMTHTGEYPFTCTVCGKGCIHSIHLKTHMMTHTGEYLFTCTVCGRGCSQLSHLKKHMRIHTGETPFKCTVCGKVYTDKSYLKRHMTSHTEGQ